MGFLSSITRSRAVDGWVTLTYLRLPAWSTPGPGKGWLGSERRLPIQTDAVLFKQAPAFGPAARQAGCYQYVQHRHLRYQLKFWNAGGDFVALELLDKLCLGLYRRLFTIKSSA